MQRNRLRRRSLGTLTAAVVLSLLFWAAPAQAAVRDCVSTANRTCTTGYVGAYSDHTIWFEIFPTANGGCSYKIRDISGAVVRSGNVLYGWVATLYNVYSRYRLELKCLIGGWGTIHGA